MFQKFMALGRIGKQPQFKTTQSGMHVCEFSLAVNKKSKQGEKTEWINCVTFAKTAEFVANYLDKGSQVFIEGEMATTTYEKDGVKKWITKINVNNVKAVGSKQDKQLAQGMQQVGDMFNTNPQVDASFSTDDIPF